MKILVCGGRDYDNKDKVFRVLNELCIRHSKFYKCDDNWLPSDVTIITGGAKGADDLAAAFAMVHWTDYKEYPADWKKYGRGAGPIRNREMFNDSEPDIVLAFPGGKGTEDMINVARKGNCEVRVLE
mgnify:CR=1 FL=1